MDSIMLTTFIAAGANIILLLGILYPALVNLLKNRSSVSTLLVAFSLVFLLQNVVAVFFHMESQYTPAFESELMVLTVMESLGFGALFWVTYR